MTTSGTGSGREDMEQGHGHEACEGCGLPTRRDVLRDAAIGAALMLGLGARRGRAAVIPRVISGRLQSGTVAYPVPTEASVSIDRDRAIIVVRTEGRLYAFYLSCPHQRTALHWIEKHHQFECPKHHSKYKPDGEFISGRATRSMDRFAVSVVDGQLQVDTGRLYREDEDPDGWASAYAVVPGGASSGASGAAGPPASAGSPGRPLG